MIIINFTIMKKIILSIVLLSSAVCASAQNCYVDAANPEMLRFGDHHSPCRREIILPSQVGGYNIYKADLHTHSVYSDGHVTPSLRVKEAWMDGLDIIAVTEHIEWRPFEKQVQEYIGKVEGTEPDLNTSVRMAQKEAAQWDIFIIPGAEITRNGTTVGHFNALFTQDNNLIYDEDPVQAIRNAKKQNALVLHNHPGWIRTSIDYTPTEQAAYDEGLIDGVEVMNGHEFYPGIIDRVRERSLFISANTDVHGVTTVDFNTAEQLRPMTLIFASERSETALREALESCRTLAFGHNILCGDENLLKDFFKASVKVTVAPDGGFMLTNMTSIPYILKREGSNLFHLSPFSTVRMGGEPVFTVLNMFCGKETHPVVVL